MNATIIIAILGAAATICVPAITKYLENKNLLNKEIRDKKILIYEDIINLFISLFLEQKGIDILNTKENPNVYILSMANITRNLINYGSSEVIIRWNKWRQASNNHDNIMMYLSLINDLFLAIRKDIGYSDKFKNQNELLNLLINKEEK